MSYSYFGNTSAKEANLLLNIELHLLLLNELFKTATKDDSWESNSSLQLRYTQIMQENKLINTKDTKLIAKNARTKVSFIKDLKLVDFDNLKITDLGNELLDLINNRKFEEKSEFLQIDLVSLFFLKNFFSYKKKGDMENVFLKYLQVFKAFNGNLTNEQFYLLPLVGNYENIVDFINILQDSNTNLVEILKGFVNIDKKERKQIFFNDWAINKKITNLSPFATSKGTGFLMMLPNILDTFVSIRNKNYNKQEVRNIFKKKIKTNKNYFRTLYLPTMLDTNTLTIYKNNYLSLYKRLFKIIRSKTENELINYFFDIIYISRYINNLDDYEAQNKYYLDLTGIFTFTNNQAKVSEIFNVILQCTNYENILNNISQERINITSLNYLFNDDEIKIILEKYGVTNSHDLNNFQYNQDKKKLEELLSTKFTKENIVKIIPSFKTRDDDQIQKSVTAKATVPTIFEYIIAIAWYYIDDKNIDFILKAGLSLDSNMLPKSHAVGGNSDFNIKYKDHTLMIEVTLTESTNQRRAEMESVSRHLGNILLKLGYQERVKSFGIFIAPYLNKNVLNDFRMRKDCYWEDESNHIKGMNILPFDCDDLVKIIESNKTYNDLRPDFYDILKNNNDWGSQWYNNTVKAYVNNL